MHVNFEYEQWGEKKKSRENKVQYSNKIARHITQCWNVG